MTVTSYVRGHKVFYNGDAWLYIDDESEVDNFNERSCIKCGNKASSTGADHCLKGLEDCSFIVAACCGHGVVDEGYIMLADGRIFKEVFYDDG